MALSHGAIALSLEVVVVKSATIHYLTLIG